MSWIMTFCGVKFDVENPKPEDILINDIAHALAHQCRFGGHCRNFYSVAEHSVYVSNMVFRKDHPPSNTFAALLHDASEAYLVDIPRPIKHLYDMDKYRAMEEKLQAAINDKFDSSPQDYNLIKWADDRMLANEIYQLMPSPQLYDVSEYHDIVIECWPPAVAERKFLERFGELQYGS